LPSVDTRQTPLALGKYPDSCSVPPILKSVFAHLSGRARTHLATHKLPICVAIYYFNKSPLFLLLLVAKICLATSVTG